jgi:hypothetical protein
LWAWLLDESIIHTAVDDLESFIWLLSWTLVHILKNYGSKDWGILEMEDNLSSTDLRYNSGKAEVLMRIWPDAAFGYLMRDWQRILTSARTQVEPLRSAFFKTSVGSPARNKVCQELEMLCDRVYEQVLKSGFSHREEISRYSRWEDVIRAMPPLTDHW